MSENRRLIACVNGGVRGWLVGWGGWLVGVVGVVGVAGVSWGGWLVGVVVRFRDVGDQKTRSIMCRSEPVG